MEYKIEGKKEQISPNIRIPEIVRQDLSDGLKRISSELEQFKPDLIVVLERSGVLAFNPVKSYFERQRVSLPPIIYAPIGREISDRFLDKRYEEEEREGNDIFAEYTSGADYIADHPDDYNDWLEKNSRVQKIIQTLTQEGNIQTLTQEGNEPKKILIIDDIKSQGTTSKFTAPFILRFAFGEDIMIETVVVFQRSDYIRLILREIFGDNISSDEEFFFTELMKGCIETDGGILRITCEEDLEKLGETTGKNPLVGRKNPYPTLKEKYGIDFLLSFPQRIRRALEEILLDKKE